MLSLSVRPEVIPLRGFHCTILFDVLTKCKIAKVFEKSKVLVTLDFVKFKERIKNKT
jgi:hypothetical protein